MTVLHTLSKSPLDLGRRVERVSAVADRTPGDLVAAPRAVEVGI